MNKYLIFFLIITLYQNNLKADEKKNCAIYKKWSSKYMSCKAKTVTGGLKKVGSSLLPEKMKDKKIKIVPKSVSDKVKSFSEKKTLMDLLKKKEN